MKNWEREESKKKRRQSSHSLIIQSRHIHHYTVCPSGSLFVRVRRISFISEAFAFQTRN